MKKTVKILTLLAVCALLAYFAVVFGKTAKDKLDRYSHPQKYSEFVSKYAKEFAVPESIIYAVIKCESSFRPNAVSSSNAKGLMQMKAATFFDLCSRLDEEHEEKMLFDPETNIKYGTYYLSLLYKRFGVWETAIAAYNAGQGNVAKWIKNGSADPSGKLTDIPFKETQTYVNRVSKARKMYEKLYYQ